MNDTFKKRALSIPGSSTYSPLDQSFRTFDHLNNSPKKSLEKKNCFGSDARFPYVRPPKKVIVEKRPDPISYTTTITWRGKKDSPKKRTWNECIWKGSSSSVYH